MEIKHRDLHRITSTAIIVKEDRYLIVKRSPNKKAFPGMWTVPGGGLEVDDYIDIPKTTSDHWYFGIERSLKREIVEEVGLTDLGRIKYLLDILFIRVDGVPSAILSFYCDYKSGEVKLNEENVEYKWVTLEEAKEYELIPGILGEIEMIDKINKGEDIDKIEYRNI